MEKSYKIYDDDDLKFLDGNKTPKKSLKERVYEGFETLLMGDNIRNKKEYAILMALIVLALGGSYLKYLFEEPQKKKKKKKKKK
tara:strand:- start:228 stop:479 length:252 start_codon:yes stop_codon:yes gene_type:complete